MTPAKLQRLVLTFKPDDVEVRVLYRTTSGAGPSTKARAREVTALVRTGLEQVLAALEGPVESIGTSGFTQREDVIGLSTASSDTHQIVRERDEMNEAKQETMDLPRSAAATSGPREMFGEQYRICERTILTEERNLAQIRLFLAHHALPYTLGDEHALQQVGVLENSAARCERRLRLARLALEGLEREWNIREALRQGGGS